MPFHSILISAFNRFDYLDHTIKSCLSSSDCDYEIIVLDDASDKGKADAFYSLYENFDPRLRIIRSKSNLGVGRRFAKLHDIANGELLHLIGSDDLMHPLRLERTRAMMESKLDYKSIMYTRAYLLDSDYRKRRVSRTNMSPMMQKACLFLQPMILHPTICSWNPKLSGLNPYRNSMRAAVDYAFYVDNYIDSSFISLNDTLTYLVHSATGITRDNKSRAIQLKMHDSIMHELWSKFIDCTSEQISIIRQFIVTQECLRYPLELVTKKFILELSELTSEAIIEIEYIVESNPEKFAFLKSKSDEIEYLAALSSIFCGIRNKLNMIAAQR